MVEIANEAKANLGNIAPSPRLIDERFLKASTLPFAVCLASIAAFVVLLIIQSTTDVKFLGGYVADGDGPMVRFILGGSLYIFLFIICIASAYVGYRMVVAAGATSTAVIPPQDYELLAPLVSEGKTESIDQYVRLSSLAKFTGTFTQLGLTGLPLATIGLTLFFAILSIGWADQFLDLTKLTLGAFIGSFVQRQVERKAENGPEKPDLLPEAVTPAPAR